MKTVRIVLQSIAGFVIGATPVVLIGLGSARVQRFAPIAAITGLIGIGIFGSTPLYNVSVRSSAFARVSRVVVGALQHTRNLVTSYRSTTSGKRSRKWAYNATCGWHAGRERSISRVLDWRRCGVLYRTVCPQIRSGGRVHSVCWPNCFNCWPAYSAHSTWRQRLCSPSLAVIGLQFRWVAWRRTDWSDGCRNNCVPAQQPVKVLHRGLPLAIISIFASNWPIL